MNRDLIFAAGGMALLLAGKKLPGLGLFGLGVYGLERRWREKHPDVAPGFAARWGASVAFYEQTHKNPVNRLLHQVGIPMIVGGAALLLGAKPFRPAWTVGAVSFGVGWALNLVGHAVYEKAAPAFADDPLSFLAGPVWDLNLLRQVTRPAPEQPQQTNGHATNGTASAAE